MFAQFTRIMRWCLLLLLCIPVLAGLVGVIFPALGYFPAIGANSFSLDVFRTLFALDDIWHMVWLSLFTGVGSTLLAMAGAFLLLATFYQSSWLEKVQGLLAGKTVEQIEGDRLLVSEKSEDINPGWNLEGSEGTLWGAYNTVTYMVDHKPVRDFGDDQRLNNAFYGNATRDPKLIAYNKAKELIAA